MSFLLEAPDNAIYKGKNKRMPENRKGCHGSHG